MNSRLLRLFLVTGVVATIFGCGGNGLPHTNQVTATVTPAAATVAPGGSVTLTGEATGFTTGPIVDWYIQESKDIDFINDCGLLTSQNPPQSGCPYGYVMFDDVTQFPSTATYYAPSTPGVYHVTFEASQFVAFDHLTKTVQAVITVQ
ncbi:MAG TPA: hypothetical protein VFM77_05950 [Terriglobales bacterium]|nr:hypothetical protein [Terriglobales bacterium]